MDPDLEVIRRKRISFSQVAIEITSVIEHAKVSRNNLLQVLKTHKDSGCNKDCLDILPRPQTLINIELELFSLTAELNAQVATATTGTFGPGYARNLLAKAYNKIEEAEKLFSELLAAISHYAHCPKKCLARKKLYQLFV